MSSRKALSFSKIQGALFADEEKKAPFYIYKKYKERKMQNEDQRKIESKR